MRLGWHLKAVVLRKEGEILIPIRLSQGDQGLFVENVAKPFEEKEGENELLVVACVDGPAQDGGRPPKVGFELLLGDAGHGERNTELNTELNMVDICV